MNKFITKYCTRYQLSNCRIEKLQVTHDTENEYPIQLSHASFSWGGKSDPVQLRDLNWKVEHGQLVAVVGIVGSGKSSLLSALLGDMQRVEGEANLNGDEKIAYVPQQAWMQNTTLQNNIFVQCIWGKATWDTLDGKGQV